MAQKFEETLAAVKREEAVLSLAVHIINCNLATYRCSAADEGELPGPFADYGTDPETVRAIMNDMLDEVVEQVTRLQRVVGDEIAR